MATLRLALSNIALGNIQSLSNIPITATATMNLPLDATIDMVSMIAADAFVGAQTVPGESLAQPSVSNLQL